MENKEQVLLRMKEGILLRGLSKNTLESYTLNVRIFLEYCNRPVEQLNEYDIRNFLWYLNSRDTEFEGHYTELPVK